MSTRPKIELFSPNTFGFSLLMAEAWVKCYQTLVLKQIGKSFKIVLVFKDAKGIHWLRSVDEQKSFNKYLVKKLKTNRNFFLRGLVEYTELLKEFRQFVQDKKGERQLSNQQAWQKISQVLLYVQRLFPFYAIIYYICNKPELSPFFKNIKKEVVKARLLSEGYYDKADQIISRLLKPRVNTKYRSYYKVLRKKEVRALLLVKKVNLSELQVRKKQNYFLTLNRFLSGKIDFKKYLDRHNYYYPLLDEELKSELVGQPVVKGLAKGKVRLILDKRNLRSIKKGEILITPMTSPDFVPYLKRVAAIVTDHGGILCHAAIAARELKKICVVGVSHATDVFKTGDLVEVDANQGLVKKLT